MEYSQYFPLTHGKYFKPQDIMKIIKAIENDLKAAEAVSMAQYQEPNVLLMLSVLVGIFGVDRMYAGQIWLGLLKLVTFGGYFMWWIIDMVTVTGRTQDQNFKKAMDYIQISKT